MFAPERWGEVDRFQRLYTGTYNLEPRTQRALTGVSAHFGKAIRLSRLAERLRPNLQEDRDQLEEHGFTPAENAAQLATVIEAAILELYSCIDCLVKVLRGVYGPGTRGFKDSTRGFFQGVEKLSGSFPIELKLVVAEAHWYARLQRLRDDLTHLDTGHVRLDDATMVVRYVHYGMKEAGGPLEIEDIFGWFTDTSSQVNAFLGRVFHHLNTTLSEVPVFQMCGMVDGRALHRFVVPRGPITFDSGSCGAWAWFELPENPTCPFKDACGAYLNKAPPQGWETDPPSSE
jgi:hypothetical protein